MMTPSGVEVWFSVYLICPPNFLLLGILKLFCLGNFPKSWGGGRELLRLFCEFFSCRFSAFNKQISSYNCWINFSTLWPNSTNKFVISSFSNGSRISWFIIRQRSMEFLNHSNNWTSNHKQQALFMNKNELYFMFLKST